MVVGIASILDMGSDIPSSARWLGWKEVETSGWGFALTGVRLKTVSTG